MSLLGVIQTAFGKKGYGWRPDKADSRDLMLGAHLERIGASTTIPASASVRDSRVSPKDQGATSSCTGQSTAQAVRLAYLRVGVSCPDLSALFSYYQGRAIEGTQGSDDGAVIRDVIKGITQFGEANEAAWPFRPIKVNTHPNVKAYRSAYDRKGVRAYHRIGSGDTVGVRRALAAGYPVVGGWNLAQSFEDYDGSGIIQAQRGPFLGGHAICVTGYQADGTFELINSWGESWGRGGYAIVSQGFMAQATDVWAIEVE